MIGAGGGSIGVLPLAGALIRVRLRSFRNGLAARGRGRFPLLVTGVGLLLAFAYVGLFAQAFAVIAEHGDRGAQVAALALVAGAIAFGSVTAKAASSEAVRAGSPENEFLLARPVSLPALVAARGVADAATDPVGALFLLPVLISAAFVWRVGPLAVPVAVLTSTLVQIAVSALAYATQLGVVRYVSPARRRVVWTALRLVAALALATLWMLGTWVLRAPAALAGQLASVAPAVAWSPGALIAAPLASLARGEAGGAFALVGLLALAAALASLAAVAVARRAGLGGWEEAGASWADVAAAPPPRRHPPTAATKDLLLLSRDLPQLLALVAMPILFVGVQIFGAAGWTWSTSSLGRVSCLAYSLALYMVTIGPLAHMQAERRAFWILRTVPVPLGRLFAAKARVWSLVVGGVAALTFAPLALAMPEVPASARIVAGLLVIGGAVAMTFLAVAMAAHGADLSDDQRTAVGPGTIYGFMAVGGLYNLVLLGDLPTRAAGLALYLYAIWAYWRAGVERAELCMDREAIRARRLRASHGATLLIVYATGTLGIARGAAAFGGTAVAAAAWVCLLIVMGLAAAAVVARAPRTPARLGAGRSFALAGGLGAAAGVLVWRLDGGPPAFDRTPAVMALAALAFAAEELMFRGVVQRSLGEELATAGIAAGKARLAAALASVVLATVATRMSGLTPVLGLGFVAVHAVAASVYARTGRITAAWTARVLAAAVAAWLS